VVLHLGDYDPSGVSIYESMKEDVLVFVEEDVLSKPPMKWRSLGGSLLTLSI